MARCDVCGELHPVATMVTAHKQPEEIPADARRERPAPRDWRLSDARALHAEHPRSFFIPTAERSRALVPGELVKLGFAYGPHADREGEGHLERMWVEVLAQGGDGGALGRLRNRPLRLIELEIGDEVAFGAHEVLSIDYSDEEIGFAQGQSTGRSSTTTAPRTSWSATRALATTRRRPGGCSSTRAAAGRPRRARDS